MEIQKKLIALREHAGISQNELAVQLHVTRQTVSRWENGAVTPPLDVLKALAKFYGVSLDWLCDEEVTELPQDEPEEKKQKAARNVFCKAILIGGSLCIVLALLFGLFCIRKHEKTQWDIQELTGEEVYVSPENGFSLK